MSATLTTETATKFAKIPQEVISASATVDLLFRATSINVLVSQLNLMWSCEHLNRVLMYSRHFVTQSF